MHISVAYLFLTSLSSQNAAVYFCDSIASLFGAPNCRHIGTRKSKTINSNFLSNHAIRISSIFFFFFCFCKVEGKRIALQLRELSCVASSMSGNAAFVIKSPSDGNLCRRRTELRVWQCFFPRDKEQSAFCLHAVLFSSSTVSASLRIDRKWD